MSIRTTVTLDDDVLSRLNEASAKRGISFKEMINDAIRSGLTAMNAGPRATTFTVRPVNMGVPRFGNLADLAAVIEASEGDGWR